MTALPTFGVEANALQVDVNAKQALAAQSVIDAAASATASAASAAASEASSGVTAWVSGTTYADGDMRYSPLNYWTYRRKGAGAGTTDPSNDATNWVLVSSIFGSVYLHVRDQKSSGTSGGASISGTQVRVLNTVVTNTMVGASLASNQITLPAGTYDCRLSAPSCGGGSHRAVLYNVTDSNVTILGESAYSADPNHSSISNVEGRFTITSSKVFEVRHFTNTAQATFGLGLYANDGLTQVYTEAHFYRVI